MVGLCSYKDWCTQQSTETDRLHIERSSTVDAPAKIWDWMAVSILLSPDEHRVSVILRQNPLKLIWILSFVDREVFSFSRPSISVDRKRNAARYGFPERRMPLQRKKGYIIISLCLCPSAPLLEISAVSLSCCLPHRVRHALMTSNLFRVPFRSMRR